MTVSRLLPAAFLLMSLASCTGPDQIDPPAGRPNLAWVTPAANTHFRFQVTTYDTISLRIDSAGTPFTNTYPDSIVYLSDDASYDTINHIERVLATGVRPEFIGLTHSYDLLVGDVAPTRYSWLLFNGLDTATQLPYPTTTETLHNVTTSDYGFELTKSTVSTCYGLETLNLPSGTFTAIKSRDSVYHVVRTPNAAVPNIYVDITTIWFVPSIGCYAKWTYAAHEQDTLAHERQYAVHVLTSYGK